MSWRIGPVTRLLVKHIKGKNQKTTSSFNSPFTARHQRREDLNTHQLGKLYTNAAPGCPCRLHHQPRAMPGSGGSLLPVPAAPVSRPGWEQWWYWCRWGARLQRAAGGRQTALPGALKQRAAAAPMAQAEIGASKDIAPFPMPHPKGAECGLINA